MITHNISLMIIMLLLSYHSRVTSGQFSFSQPATGPSSVCEGSDVTLQCRIVFDGNAVESIWFRNGTTVRMGVDFIPNHNQIFNSTTGVRTDLVITDVTLEDDNTVYSCNSTDNNITSSVELNVLEIPPIDNLMVTDQCTTIRASWDITEGSCTNLSYDVTLLSSDGVILQGPFTTSDTVYNFVNVMTLNGTFNVTVVPINANARGASVTEMSVINILQGDLPTVTNIRITKICVTYFDISWDPSGITCGDVYYEVSISPPPIEGDTVVTTVDSFLSVTGLNNSLPDVIITVTAINRAGRGDGTIFSVQLPRSLDAPYTTAYNVTISSSLTPADLSGFDIMISWTRPPITDPCTTLPITGYYIHAIVTNVNGDASERIYTSNRIDDTMGDGMGRFSVSYNDSFDQELEPNANYAFVVNTQNNIIEIPRTGTRPSCDDDESDDELSTGAAVTISIVVTFIITLVVTTLISIIITSMYYKHLIDRIRKSVISQEGDPHEDINKYDSAYATTIKTNIIMDANPAYETTTAIKMDTNPAYAITT